MENEIKKIMSEIFMINPKTITNETIMSNVERWDSLTHMVLITKFEEFFNIKFEIDEMVEMTSFEKILAIIKNKE